MSHQVAKSAEAIPLKKEAVRVPTGGMAPVFVDFLRFPLLKKAMQSRFFQPALLLPNLFIFVILIMAGLVGTPVGNRNAAIVILWILWFFVLISLIIPLGGRTWCAMCPLPAPAEWISRWGIVRKIREKPWALGWKWSKKLDNIWLQNIGFLAIATFSPVILTRPEATSYLLLILIALSLVLGLSFVKQNKAGRIFCRYVCPVGGFIGLYSLMGALEIKVKDPAVCKKDKDRQCVKGNERAWGCPWYEFPGNMQRNLYCGLCAECIKACRQDNLSFRLRPFAADLLKERKLDEAYKSFIMLGCALTFITVFFGWWGPFKAIANPIGTSLVQGPVNWKNLAIFSSSLFFLTLALIPGIHLSFCWLARWVSGVRTVPLKKLFIDYAYALVPLSLLAWIAFVLGMIMVNGSYVVSVISDPLGWGWDLFGTADYPWRPYYPELIPYLQLALLLVGLVATTHFAYRISREHFPKRGRAVRAAAPMVGFFILTSVVFLYLFMV